MNELISVIIPVYNTEKYLDKCIQSVLNQTYRNLEIIIIDDGSTDGSEKICDRYERQDKRIIVVHKRNEGQASARNVGLAVAKGHYIGFVDSDDYIADDMYECLAGQMTDDVDIACCGMVYVLPGKKQKMYCLNGSQKFSNPQAMENLLAGKTGFEVCSKLFRRELFDDIRFPEGKTSEDMPVTYAALKKSRNFVHIGQGKYFYVYRQNSTVNREFSRGRVTLALFAGEIARDAKMCYPELASRAEAEYIMEIINVIQNIKKSSDPSCFYDIESRLKKALIHMLPRIICNPHINNKNYIVKNLFRNQWI